MPSTSTVETNTGRVINVDQTHPRLNLLYDDSTGTWNLAKARNGLAATANYIWDTGSLQWVVQTAAGGGGGGAATIADGADVTQGAIADAAITNNAAGTLSGKLRGIVAILASVWDSVNGRLKVDGSGVTQPVSLASTTITGTVAVTGTFWQATQPVSIASWTGLTDAQLRAAAVPVSLTSTTLTGTSAFNLSQYLGSAVGAANAVHVQPGTGATFATIPPLPNTGTRSSVAASAADTSLLASNTSRRGATIYNEGSTTLYLALGAAAASLTSYTLQIAVGGYYEVPFNYTGAIRGIWAGSPTGSARITELT